MTFTSDSVSSYFRMFIFCDADLNLLLDHDLACVIDGGQRRSLPHHEVFYLDAVS